MNYFQCLSNANDRLSERANKLLQGLNVPERSNHDVCSENWDLAHGIFTASGEDWDSVSENVASIADGYLPYSESCIGANGSLAYTLGLSMAAVEYNANLLNLELKGLIKSPRYITCVAKIDIINDILVDTTPEYA